MPKTKVVLNRGAVRALLRGPEVSADLDRRADRIAAAAGDGFAHETGQTGNRARAAVWTETREAREAEADGRALTRAVTAGRQ